jgi:plastocyanin
MTSFAGTTLRYGGAVALALFITQSSSVADTVTIKLKSAPNRYEPRDVTVKVGDTVVWANESGLHTVTPDDNQPDPFKGSDEFSPPKTYEVVIGGAPRTIKYHCEIHGQAMSGQIVITAAASPSPTPTASPTPTPTPK